MKAIAILFLVLVAGYLPAFALDDAIDAGLNCFDTTHPQQIEECTKAIQSGKVNPKSLANLYTARGEAYADRGQRDEAIADFREALRRDPNYTLAAARLSELGVEP